MTDGHALHALATRQASFKVASSSKKRKADGESWPLPPGHSVTPSSLAAAGFYWAPLPDADDNATCFLCEKGLGGWEDGDLALQEHVSHSIKASVKKGCPFALLLSGSKSLQSLGLEEGKDLVKMRKDTFGKKSKFWVHAGKRGWPTPDKMANAGFFLNASEPTSDAGQCCWCGLLLDGWEKGDEPAVEHFKRKPSCRFFEQNPALVAQLKGEHEQAQPGDEAPEDEGWEQLIPDSKPKTKKPSRSKANQSTIDDSIVSDANLSVAPAGPLTRSTRSGMIASLASQPHASTSKAARVGRSKPTSRDQSTIIEAPIREDEPDEAPVPPAKTRSKGKGKGQAEPEPEPPSILVEDSQQDVELQDAPADVPAIFAESHPPPSLPDAQQPETIPHSLSMVVEAAEEDDPEADEDMPPPPPRTAQTSQPSPSRGIPGLAGLQARLLAEAQPASRPAPAPPSAEASKPVPPELAGLSEQQLGMTVKQWFEHLIELEMARAEKDMQAKLDEFDSSVTNGWDQLKAMGIV